MLKTIDGNDISLDVIIAYRIDANKAPHILQYVARDDVTLRDKIVRTVARSKPRDIFGELKTEAFYVADAREAQSSKAKEALQKILGPMGIIVEKVLTNDYRFNPEYQKAIEDKKVADQQVEKNKSAQHAATEEYKRKLEEAKGEVNKMVADADGQYLKDQNRGRCIPGTATASCQGHPGRRHCGSQRDPGNEQRPGRIGRRGDCEAENRRGDSGKAHHIAAGFRGWDES